MGWFIALSVRFFAVNGEVSCAELCGLFPLKVRFIALNVRFIALKCEVYCAEM
jgi:hypothetical protein